MFDFSHVHKALEHFQPGSETSYLEKIVQLAIEIPHPPPSALTAVLWDGLDTVAQSISSDKYEQARWNEVRFGPLSLFVIFLNACAKPLTGGTHAATLNKVS